MEQTNHSFKVWGAKSVRALRVLWTLHELDLPYEHYPIRSRSGETTTPTYTALNPRQKIPVLQDGELVLAESAAIVTYLADRYGALEAAVNSASRSAIQLIPASGSEARGLYYQWCFFMMTELDAHTLYILRKHRDLVDIYGDAPNALKEAEAGFQKQVGVVAQAFQDGRQYLVGESFTGADIILVSIVNWAINYKQPVPEILVAYADRLHQRPAYQTASAATYD